jgi:hypothetical protein
LTYDRDAVRNAFKDIGANLIKATLDIKDNSAWVEDIAHMHQHYGVNEVVDKFDPAKLRALLEFRLRFLGEELTEMEEAIEEGNPEEIVDALIDLCVVAIGTLDLFRVDAKQAWDRVHHANMAKEVGIKESRPNPLGLPDLVKPQGWVAPWHGDNHGLLAKAFDAGEAE